MSGHKHDDSSATGRGLRHLLGETRGRDLVAAAREVVLFAGVSSVEELEARLRREVDKEVAAMLSLVADFDAFDVLELMRLRELVVSPEQGLDPSYDGSAAALDLIALVLISRGSRCPGTTPPEETEPHTAVPELHKRAKRLLGLGMIRAKASEQLRGGDPLHRLAAEYQAYCLNVRALQYESVQDKHERALFERPEIDPLLQEHLGFTYSQFAAVRQAITELHADRLSRCVDTTAEIVEQTNSENRGPTDEEVESFRKAMFDWMFRPGRRAEFTSEEIASSTGLGSAVVDAVLETFAIDFDSSTGASARVFDFLHARNPVSQSGLLRDADRYLTIAGPIGGDRFRQVVENALKNTSAWDRYDKTRCAVSETLAVSSIERALAVEASRTAHRYYAPKDGQEVEALGAGCTALMSVGEVTEGDALFVLDDVAVCVEVKGRAVAEQARRGDIPRLKTEIKRILGDGARQARRLESLIATNGGFWADDGSWVDLGHVREVHTVVVGVDYLGPLGVALGDLALSGLVGPLDAALPWIVSLHDLEVICKVVDRPTEFLLYLRRRSRSLVATHYRGADELDLFMLFLDGGLYVEDDPDEVHERNPRTPTPSYTARKRHKKDARPTLVGTFTNPLDAWMYWCEGRSSTEVEKPAFEANDQIARLVDFLADGHKPGWIRMGTDLLGLHGDAQFRLLASIEELQAKTAVDGKPHDLAQGYASADGYPTVFVGTVPPGADRKAIGDRLYSYMRLKRHQLRSDRSLGLLLSADGRIEGVVYMNDLPVDDTELDELVKATGLKETWKRPKRHPALSAKKRRRRRKQKGPRTERGHCD